GGAAAGCGAAAVPSGGAGAVPSATQARRGWGGLRGADVAALWFGAGAAVTLMSNRIAYDLGVALGLAAIALVQHRRRWASLALAALASLASPVAGAFLVLAAGAWVAGSTRLRRPGGPGGLMADRSVVVGALFLAGGA